MPQSHKRKTGRASMPLEDMDRAVKEVEKGKPIRQVASALTLCSHTGVKVKLENERRYSRYEEEVQDEF
ncbi:hypothetical protein MHYP_G00244330 [Metynnis hypsauchen]